MKNLQQNNTTNKQSTATFSLESLSDLSPEFLTQLQNLHEITVAEKVLESLCFEISGKCDRWAMTVLMMIFNSLSASEYSKSNAECFQTVCFRWTNEAAYAEYAFVDAIRGQLPDATEQPATETEPTRPISEPARPISEPAELAAALSAILNNPNLPRRLYDGIADGIMETYNDIEAKPAVNDSPEYIEKVLTVYEEMQRATDEADRAERLNNALVTSN